MVLCISLAVSQLWAQATRTVTGKVTDAQGNPVAAAAVQVRGTKIGTTTAADGTFRLNVPENATTLVITSLNFREQEVNIAGQSNVTVALTEAATSLDEVVVTVPYGTVKRSAFTGAQTTINAKQVEKQQVTSVTRALEGLAPGIMATNGGGAPGSGAAIVIRGFNSINAANGPLYVVNGVPYDGLITGIAPEDIESISVLKDAAASALYGSRAAGGVIMIVTKSGKKGRPAVNVRVTQGFMSRGIPEYDRVGAKDYYEGMWEATRNSFIYNQAPLTMAAAGVKASNELTSANNLVYNAYNVAGNQLVDPVTGKLNPNAQLLWNDSWEDVLFRTAPRLNANLSISGAGDKSDYYMSIGYTKEVGTMKFTDYERFTFRANINSQATTWMKAGLNLDGSYAERNDVINGGTATSNPFYYTRYMGPIYPVWQRNTTTGEFILDAQGGRVLDWGVPTQMGARPYAANSNLLGTLELDDRSTKRYNANVNPYIELALHKTLTFRTNLGLNIWEDNGTTYQNNQFGDAQNVMGRSTKQFDRQLSLTANQILTWNKDFGNHNVRALVGHENYMYRYSVLSGTRIGFAYPGQTELTNAGATEGFPSSREDNHRIESYFTNVNYDYQGKYLLSASVRTDGSSRFSNNVRWGTFYSAGIGWNIAREDFMKNVNWLNELKLRASYGEVGQENIGLFYQYGNYYYSGGQAPTGGQTPTYDPPNRPANVDLQWEKNVKFNVGVDFAILKNRVQGTIEYFRNTSQDLLFDVELPPSTGFLSAYQNVGANQNRGIELFVGYNAIRRRNFDWRIDLNLTHITNEVTRLAPIHEAKGGFNSGNKRFAAGRSQFDFWLRDFAGVDAATGEALYYRDVVPRGADNKPTGARTVTNNINLADFYFVGSAIPDFNGGITNAFRYKNFELSLLVTFAYGGKFYDGNYAGLMHSGSYGTAWHTDILKRWQKPGDVTNIPKLHNNVANQDGASSRFLFDASYLNFKNINLSYSLPVKTANRLHLASLQMFGSVDNAYLFTAKKGMDPQRDFGGNSNATFPPFRTISFGLNASF